MLQVIPIKVDRKNSAFDLYKDLVNSLKDQILENGDILVISSKYVANSENRFLDLEQVRISSDASELAKKHQLNAKLAEVILRESDRVFGGVTGFVLTSADGILAPNAGIDKSNVRKGTIVLYPDQPYKTAENLRRRIFLDYKIHVGVIIVDSRLMPVRSGTTGVAIACAGIEPVRDMRGQRDLDGNPLKVTLKATADNLATIANHEMGEGNESTPIAIVRNSNTKLVTRKIRNNEMTVSPEQCIYIRSFGQLFV